ncbi:hypothetical protein PV325_007419 [Microctonus aethiopoides]|nr:hypothetical protein PV325_007419 [Microctonus aethiopoides]
MSIRLFGVLQKDKNFDSGSPDHEQPFKSSRQGIKGGVIPTWLGRPRANQHVASSHCLLHSAAQQRGDSSLGSHFSLL